ERPCDWGRVAERNGAKAWRKRAEAVLILGLRREPDDGRGSTVKIAVRDDDLRLIPCHSLDAIAPAARGFDGGLDRLCSGVHRQRGVECRPDPEFLKERCQAMVVVGGRRDRGASSLPLHSGKDR